MPPVIYFEDVRFQQSAPPCLSLLPRQCGETSFSVVIPPWFYPEVFLLHSTVATDRALLAKLHYCFLNPGECAANVGQNKR